MLLSFLSVSSRKCNAVSQCSFGHQRAASFRHHPKTNNSAEISQKSKGCLHEGVSVVCITRELKACFKLSAVYFCQDRSGLKDTPECRFHVREVPISD